MSTYKQYIINETVHFISIYPLYLEKVFEQMKTEGFDCSEEMIRKQSPLISDHINFVGKYSFRYEKELSNGILCPLNIENY